MNNKKLNKATALLVVAAAFLIISVGATLAYVAYKTPEVTNEFEPVAVSCAVEEEFANGVKSQVKVRNTGDTTAFIRVAIVVNWVNDANGTVLATAPIEAQDYTLTLNANGWKKGTDGYYYYENPVKIDQTTDTLISSATAINQPEGYSLSIQVLASALQSDPKKAVEQSWGATIMDGVLVPN